MKHIKDHLKLSMDDKNRTERGELMKYFCEQLNSTRSLDGLPPITMGRMGKMLQQIPTKDLYYLKSICEKATNFSKKFWWEINPKNHTPEERAKAAEKFKNWKAHATRNSRLP